MKPQLVHSTIKPEDDSLERQIFCAVIAVREAEAEEKRIREKSMRLFIEYDAIKPELEKASKQRALAKGCSFYSRTVKEYRAVEKRFKEALRVLVKAEVEVAEAQIAHNRWRVELNRLMFSRPDTNWRKFFEMRYLECKAAGMINIGSEAQPLMPLEDWWAMVQEYFDRLERGVEHDPLGPVPNYGIGLKPEKEKKLYRAERRALKRAG